MDFEKLQQEFFGQIELKQRELLEANEANCQKAVRSLINNLKASLNDASEMTFQKFSGEFEAQLDQKLAAVQRQLAVTESVAKWNAICAVCSAVIIVAASAVLVFFFK